MTNSKIFLFLCLGFVLGIFLRSIFAIPWLIIQGFLILSLIMVSVFFKYKKIALFGFCLLSICFGVLRYRSAELKALQSALVKLNDNGEQIALVGIIVKDPVVSEKSTKIVVRARNIEYRNDIFYANDEVLITVLKYPEYHYGNELRVIGKLETPDAIEGFNYKDYLRKDGIYSVMSWPKIEVIKENSGNPLMKAIFSFKNAFKEADRKFFSPPQQGLLEALIFGDESNVPQEWKNLFNITGTRHITAVSGMNITIISSLVLSFLISLGLWRKTAIVFAFVLMILYILMVGAPASAVRAAVMGGLVMIAQFFGRMSASSRSVVFAAAFMIFLNPFILKDDVGFQLSFLAMLGMIYFQAVFVNLLKAIPDPNIFQLRTALATTFSAQIFTIPILIFNFGRISLISPVTNIFIVPLLSLVSILIFVFGLSAILFLPLSYIFFFPCWVLLTYIIKIIELSAKIPYSSFAFKGIGFEWLGLFYATLGLVAWKLNKAYKLRFLNY